MTDGAEYHRKRRSLPDKKALQRMLKSFTGGARVVRLRRLGGGLGGATHLVEVQPKVGRSFGVVLKRFPNDSMEEVAEKEWERIVFAQRINVSTPEPVAFDGVGEWFGHPAFVMSQVSGRPNVAPKGLDVWLHEIAAGLHSIQQTSVRGVPRSMRYVGIPERWEPPEGLRMTPLVAKVVEVVGARFHELQNTERAMAHGDFHPGNLLWSRRRLTGVVDWPSARIRSKSYDVAYCRTDLTLLLGPAVADRFLVIFESVSGEPVGPELPLWDLVCGLNPLRWGHLWVMAYREQGQRDLTPRHVAPRVNSFLRKALASV